jgi:hypothetical protein
VSEVLVTADLLLQANAQTGELGEMEAAMHETLEAHLPDV